ncbi:MAG TPA: hypothetical protein PLF87_09415 [Syntrophorhabdaceae bacterium]|nr:hypothetical protein [Syntrophorhabdaceae bacterium]MDI9561476.1 hypothetical protein [Pseudomonadota bacterium]HNQ64040.1 hypothetical protein [Syntrophorhabdaceae bacterium]HOB70048.1 hypothetical protein [Syntrophorhabdaceae bacterium]HOF57427.1 hypothetical protein [Syntrophorhabdaceae bacterium]
MKQALSTEWMGYLDFTHLYIITLIPAYFVISTKSNIKKQRACQCLFVRTTGLKYGQIILLVEERGIRTIRNISS